MKKILPYLMLAMLIASAAHGATAYRYSDSVTTVRGDAVGGASVTVYNANTTTKATLYMYPSSAAGTKGNPTYTDGYGRFYFYLLPGTYDFVITGTNITSYTVEDVRIFSDTGYTYNIVDYGAIPNDGTDDSAAIQSAVDAAEAAGRGAVYTPSGNWTISSTVAVADSNITLYGDAGSIWTSPTAISMLDIQNGASNIEVRGMSFTTTAVAGQVAGRACIHFNIAEDAPGPDNIKITDCNVYNTMSGAIGGGQVSNVIISNNTLSNVAEHGIYMAGNSWNTTIIGNVIKTSRTDSIAGCGIKITGDKAVVIGNAIADFDSSYGVLIENGAGGYVVSGNIISGCRGAVRVGNTSNVTVSGNAIRSQNLIGHSGDIEVGTSDGPVDSLLITGNTFFGDDSSAANITRVMRKTGGNANYTVFSGNVITGHYDELYDGAGFYVRENYGQLVTRRSPLIVYSATAPTDTTGMRGQLMWFDPTGGDTLKVYTGTPLWRWKALH